MVIMNLANNSGEGMAVRGDCHHHWVLGPLWTGQLVFLLHLCADNIAVGPGPCLPLWVRVVNYNICVYQENTRVLLKNQG